jgi:hypothetical protein
VQKLRAKDIEEKKEAEHDMWFKKGASNACVEKNLEEEENRKGG